MHNITRENDLRKKAAMLCAGLVFGLTAVSANAAVVHKPASHVVVDIGPPEIVQVAIKSKAEARRLLSRIKKHTKNLKSINRKLEAAIIKAKRVNAQLR